MCSLELKIEEFMSIEKRNIIEKEIHKHDTFSLTPIKEALGSNFTYGEIRLVIADMQREAR